MRTGLDPEEVPRAPTRRPPRRRMRSGMERRGHRPAREIQPDRGPGLLAARRHPDRLAPGPDRTAHRRTDPARHRSSSAGHRRPLADRAHRHHHPPPRGRSSMFSLPSPRRKPTSLEKAPTPASPPPGPVVDAEAGQLSSPQIASPKPTGCVNPGLASARSPKPWPSAGPP